MGEQAPFYIFTAFVFSYGVGTLKISRDLLLVSVMAASVLSLVTVPLSGHLSDRFGRRRTYMLGAVLTGIYGFIYVALLNTLSPLLVFVAIVVSLIPHDIMYGPQAALIAECFPGRLRYSGASIGYQLASVIAGGPAPLIVAWLLAQVQVRVGDRRLHPRLRGDQPHRYGIHAGPHEQGDPRALTGARSPGQVRARWA